MTQENLTDLVFVIDESGSMMGLEKDTVGGCNRVLEANRELPGRCRMTTWFFSNDAHRVQDHVDVRDAEPFSTKTYRPHGCTALLDAMGEAIQDTERLQTLGTGAAEKSRVVFVVMTDGEENASRHFTSEQVKHMVREREAEGWEFLFLAANIDAVEAAGSVGIRADRAASFSASPRGIETGFDAVAEAACCARAAKPISQDWARGVE